MKRWTNGDVFPADLDDVLDPDGAVGFRWRPEHARVDGIPAPGEGFLTRRSGATCTSRPFLWHSRYTSTLCSARNTRCARNATDSCSSASCCNSSYCPRAPTASHPASSSIRSPATVHPPKTRPYPRTSSTATTPSSAARDPQSPPPTSHTQCERTVTVTV